MSKSTCSFENCTNPSRARNLCWAHYKQWHRGKDLGPVAAVDPQRTLEERFWLKVEQGPGCWEWTASKIKGHGRLGHEGRTVYAHRLSYEIAIGPIPGGMEIDHICHNRGCVNPRHLRVVTPKQNNENRAGANPNSKSGVRGVHWRKDRQMWQAVIHAGPKMHHVGYFIDLADAEAAAIAKRNELFTHNNVDRKAA